MSHPMEDVVWEKPTEFEVKFDELKQAKAAARQAQSDHDRLCNELVALKKKITEAELTVQKSRKGVDDMKDELIRLFGEEMRNY